MRAARLHRLSQAENVQASRRHHRTPTKGDFMKPNLRNLAAQAVFIITLMSNLGCGAGGPRTYPVQGKVELAGADVKLLAGSHVEFALAADPRVRASGEIQEDGSFKL